MAGDHCPFVLPLPGSSADQQPLFEVESLNTRGSVAPRTAMASREKDGTVFRHRQASCLCTHTAWSNNKLGPMQSGPGRQRGQQAVVYGALWKRLDRFVYRVCIVGGTCPMSFACATRGNGHTGGQKQLTK